MIDLIITTNSTAGNSTTFPNRRNKLRDCPRRLASVVLVHGVFVLVQGVLGLRFWDFVLVTPPAKAPEILLYQRITCHFHISSKYFKIRKYCACLSQVCTFYRIFRNIKGLPVTKNPA